MTDKATKPDVEMKDAAPTKEEEKKEVEQPADPFYGKISSF